MARSSDVDPRAAETTMPAYGPHQAQGRPSESLLRLDHHPTTEASVVAEEPQTFARPPMPHVMTHVIVLPGGGYAEHAAHEGEPVVEWLESLGLEASVFRYPAARTTPCTASRPPGRDPKAATRRAHPGGADRIFSRRSPRWYGGAHFRRWSV